MRNPIYNYHSGGSSLSDNCMLEEGIFASISAASLELPNNEPSNELAIDTAHPSVKDIPIWLAISSDLITREQDDDDEDDYQDPDDDEILGMMFPDEDDDFWNDNYDI